MAPRTGGVSGISGGARFFRQHSDDSVDRRIDLVQAGKHRIDGFARRGLAGPDEACEIGRVVLPEFHQNTVVSLRHVIAERCFSATDVG